MGKKHAASPPQSCALCGDQAARPCQKCDKVMCVPCARKHRATIHCDCCAFFTCRECTVEARRKLERARNPRRLIGTATLNQRVPIGLQ